MTDQPTTPGVASLMAMLHISALERSAQPATFITSAVNARKETLDA